MNNFWVHYSTHIIYSQKSILHQISVRQIMQCRIMQCRILVFPFIYFVSIILFDRETETIGSRSGALVSQMYIFSDRPGVKFQAGPGSNFLTGAGDTDFGQGPGVFGQYFEPNPTC